MYIHDKQYTHRQQCEKVTPFVLLRGGGPQKTNNSHLTVMITLHIDSLCTCELATWPWSKSGNWIHIQLHGPYETLSLT